MAPRFTVKFDWDDRQLRKQVDKWEDRSKDFRPVFRQIRSDLEKSWSANYTSNGLLVGGWKPLDAKYASWKSVNFPGTPPMIRTGALFKSLANLRGNPNEINRMSARFGTNIEYAKFHQYGTSRMPKRQIIYVPGEAERRWAEMAADYIVGDWEEGR
jgi:phage gpG-like protein